MKINATQTVFLTKLPPVREPTKQSCHNPIDAKRAMVKMAGLYAKHTPVRKIIRLK